MNWMWPLEKGSRQKPEIYNNLTWGFQTKGMDSPVAMISAPKGSSVYAVEGGVVLGKTQHRPILISRPNTHIIYVSGKTGVVGYWVLRGDAPGPGSKVHPGGWLGSLSDSYLCLHLSPPWTGSENPTPEELDQLPLLSPEQHLRYAWTRVTTRFHRDVTETEELTKGQMRRKIQNLMLHPIWPTLEQGMRQKIEYVDPKVEKVLGPNGWYSDSRNTAFRVVLIPPAPFLEIQSPSLEEGLVALAQQVTLLYGLSESRLPYAPQICSHSRCMDAGDGFCSVCGFLVPAPYTE